MKFSYSYWTSVITAMSVWHLIAFVAFAPIDFSGLVVVDAVMAFLWIWYYVMHRVFVPEVFEAEG